MNMVDYLTNHFNDEWLKKIVDAKTKFIIIFDHLKNMYLIDWTFILGIRWHFKQNWHMTK